jgi:hypothetical protein
VLDSHVFDVIDGQGHLLNTVAGEIVGELMPLYRVGALYGDTFADAARVDTGAAVNTPETIAARELHAVVALRTSPAAEMLELELVRTPITEVV